MKFFYSVLFSLIIIECTAQPGSLDIYFGSGGKVITDFSNSYDFCYGMAIQNDGKIILAGNTTGAAWTFLALARYNTDGSLDNTFGTNGKVVGSFSPREVRAITLQNDGKIIVGGYVPAALGGQNFYLARFNLDGTVDRTFGSYGSVADAVSSVSSIQAIALQSDGKIIAAGTAANAIYGFMGGIKRYNSDGSVDSSFGTSGRIILKNQVLSILIQDDGKIVVNAEQTGSVEQRNFSIYRLNSNGSSDTAFNAPGNATVDFGITSLALQNDGKIVAVGGANQLALVRFNSNGRPDSTFATNGKFTANLGSSVSYFSSVNLQSDGKIVAAGNNGAHYLVARFDSNGVLDNSFGVNGMSTTDVTPTNYCTSSKLYGNRIFIAGTSTNPPNLFEDFSMVSYNADQGTLPIMLSYFEAKRSAKNVELSWQTLSEKNVTLFEIERSNNGASFTKINEVRAVGNSISAKSYSASDINPLRDINYYRLKIIDINGTFQYSPIKIVSFNSTNNYSVNVGYKDGKNFTVNVNSKYAFKSNIKIVDVNGKTFGTYIKEVGIGDNSFTFKLNSVPTGIYYLIIHGPEDVQTFPIKIN